jgi:hypothetical protein
MPCEEGGGVERQLIAQHQHQPAQPLSGHGLRRIRGAGGGRSAAEAGGRFRAPIGSAEGERRGATGIAEYA